MDRSTTICLIIVGIQIAVKKNNTELIGNKYNRSFIFHKWKFESNKNSGSTPELSGCFKGQPGKDLGDCENESKRIQT
jgi:hypothetical protein